MERSLAQDFSSGQINDDHSTADHVHMSAVMVITPAHKKTTMVCQKS